ncbi:hypothetical protein VKT23_008547 [Stygiomarasmius scandens]|uniref:Glutaminase A central domain-containing protein n=1 Tax=Marasmiellus scandens TaxID=2682957 RepID=A0ABR1JJ22_9AGAR
MAYDLYADLLLQTKLINESVYDTQTQFCQDQLSAEIQQGNVFGIPLSSASGSDARSTWTMFTAATLRDNNTMMNLIHSIFTKASVNQSDTDLHNFPVVYDVRTGRPFVGASPQQGSMFALLTLSTAGNSSDLPPAPQPSSNLTPPKSKIGLVVGAVLGSFVAVGITLAIIVFIWRRRRRIQLASFVPDPFPGHQKIASAMTSQIVNKSISNFDKKVPKIITQISPISDYSSKLTGGPFITPSDDVGTSAPSQSNMNPDIHLRAAQLRSDLNMLRRELEEIRAQRDYGTMPPPEYA